MSSKIETESAEERDATWRAQDAAWKAAWRKAEGETALAFHRAMADVEPALVALENALAAAGQEDLAVEIREVVFRHHALMAQHDLDVVRVVAADTASIRSVLLRGCSIADVVFAPHSTETEAEAKTKAE